MDKRCLCKKCSGEKHECKFLPRLIDDYREIILARVAGEEIKEGHKDYPIFSNIAYNLQYLEYLDRCFDELYLTSVLKAQNRKVFILTASQIIEALLYYKLLNLKVDKKELWSFSHILRFSKEKNCYGLGPDFYKKEMRFIKDLRDKVHIQVPEDIAEADYAIFEKEDVLEETKKLLFSFLQKVLQLDTERMQKLFHFLTK